MSTLPEQFSAARKSQVEAQINFFSDFTARAVESTRKLVELNLATTRASMEQSTAALCHLMTVKDPRDLITLTTPARANFETMLQYGRALAGIASQSALPASAAKAAPQGELALEVPAKFSPEIAPAVAPEPATPKPIAKAATTVVAKAAAKPAAAPVPAADEKVVVTSLKAVEATPPAARTAGKPAAPATGKPAAALAAGKPAAEAKAPARAKKKK